jgi:hypothetical protein
MPAIQAPQGELWLNCDPQVSYAFAMVGYAHGACYKAP